MLLKNLRNALVVLMVVMLFTVTITPVRAAGTVTVPQNVTPVKSWSVVVGTSYKIPDDQKKANDTYASSNTAIVTVNASTGQFTPQAAGMAYIVATNGGQSRYFKVTASTTVSTAPATSVFDGYAVTVLDTTTPATTVWSDFDSTASTFYSVNGNALGGISTTAYLAIMDKYNANKTGSGPHTPPDGSGDWQAWFAEQFNLYRGLSAGAGTAAAADNVAATTEQYRQEVIRLINKERSTVGLPDLSVDNDAMAYAQIRAQELVLDYSHIRPNGAAKEVNGIRPTENIAMGGYTPETVVAAWMASETHKGNILNSDAYAVGIGAYQNTPGGNWYWALVFLW